MVGLIRLAIATIVLVGFFALIAYASQIIDAAERAYGKWQRRGQGPASTARPIEVVAAHARRLRRECALVPAGAPLARRHGVLKAYDDILTEAAHALAVEHELGALPLGPARDLERLRVEVALEATGFRLTG